MKNDKMKNQYRVNEQIRVREVRVVSEGGSTVMATRSALEMAREQGVDLVEISPNAQPPVCRLIDYSKFLYQQKKHAKEMKAKQAKVEIKEIRLSLNIDTNDFNTKVNQAAKFLQQGHKLKVSIRFRGREMAHTSLGLEVHKRFADALAGKAVIDKQPKLEGRSMMMFMSPVPNK